MKYTVEQWAKASSTTWLTETAANFDQDQQHKLDTCGPNDSLL